MTSVVNDSNIDDCVNAAPGAVFDRAGNEASCQTGNCDLPESRQISPLQDLQEFTESQAKLIKYLELELERCNEQLRGSEDALSKARSELHYALSKCNRFEGQEKELQDTKQALFRTKRELELADARCRTLKEGASGKYSVECFKDHPADVQFYTGMLSYGHLMSLWEFLAPGEDGKNIKVWSTTYSEKTTNAGRNPLMSSKEQLFLVLVRLRLGLFERDLAYRFKVSVGTVSKLCITWINYILVHLGQQDLWLPRAEVDDAMPPAFKERCPSSRVILDATEVRCEA
ncbi:hypothetical protein HPB47_010410 [Ixodes persulcatus]|uniref:Uncharacterized protein n=1 Tax=Ixodes persulcatus TaxID=34615 RepID=A0AC60NZ65_IXOPE|nr:hypothetical protein HPB47_010410 [Ixodes persulcatus]